jgi:mono/diheme cytochrome c family protein
VTLKQVVKGIELLAAVAAVVFVIMLFANEPDDGGTPQPSAGARLFSVNCAGCHGADGGGGVGPKLAGEVTTDFPNIDDQIAVVRDGRRSMPAFGGDLTDEQLRQVVEYTRTELGR